MNKLWKYLFVIIILSCSLSHDKEHKIVIVDSARLNDTLNVFLYTNVALLHESAARYIAICKESCDIKQDEKTVGFTPTYSRIDSVVGKRIYLASKFNVENLNITDFMFWINYSGNEIGPAPKEFRKLISLDTCEINL